MTICFGGKESELISDSDLAGDIDGRKSTSGYLVTHSGGQWLGKAGCKTLYLGCS
jgi:hypothetical protein